MDLEAVGLTDVGLEREHNEDSHLLLPEAGLYLVADGMGGHRAGDVASQLAVQTVREFFAASESGDSTWPYHFDTAISFDQNRIKTAIQLANAAILRSARSESERQGMGTTVVALLGSRSHDRVYVCHVGDSRCYRFRDGTLTQLTEDHSLYNEYVQNMPELGEERLAQLPKNVITRALGMQEQVAVDEKPHDVVAGDVFLLCTDGLSGMVSDDHIREHLAGHLPDLQAAARALVTAALEGGGEDNVTVVLVRVRPTSGPPGEK
jgi:PPM family protein phosphatase